VAESLLAAFHRASGSRESSSWESGSWESSSWEDAAERAGSRLSELLPRSKDAELIKSQAREESPTRLIGHVSARLDPGSDQYVASLRRLGLRGLPLKEGLAEEHNRLLQGGFYAEIHLGYDPEASSGEHFRVEDLSPIEPSSGNLLETLIDRRSAFSPGEWLCLLAWSLGLEPGGPRQKNPSQKDSGQEDSIQEETDEKPPETGGSSGEKGGPFQETRFSEEVASSKGANPSEEANPHREANPPEEGLGPRALSLTLLRLVPLVEPGYNLVELGPPGTGKTYLCGQLSPHAHTVPGGEVTTAKLFFHAGTRERGLVSLREVVCLDEIHTGTVGETAASALKSYMETGEVGQGTRTVQSSASVVMIGNTERPPGKLLEEGHLLSPLPSALAEDAAFFGRLHAFVPGWEIPQVRGALLTEEAGLTRGFLAECFSQLRTQSRVPALRQRAELTGNLTERDRRAVWKTTSGLVKLLCPGPGTEAPDDVLRWALAHALEARLRVRAQQRRLRPEKFEEGRFGFRIYPPGDGPGANPESGPETREETHEGPATCWAHLPETNMQEN
jgi:predicted ATP-dependent Lon-type protease